MILLAKVYSGNYLEENIGHEFINNYTTDDGEQYIYVTPWQKVRKSNDAENYIIQLRYAGKKCYEVLFFAEIDSFSVDSDGKQLKYGGFNLEELLGSNDINAGIYAHLKANYLKKCKPNTYICTDANFQLPNNPTKIVLDSSFNFGRQRRYVYNGNVYDQLLKFIKDDTKWENKGNSKLEIKEYVKPKINILNVIGKQYDELAFSNWLSFYLNNPYLCKKFVEECLFNNANIDSTLQEESLKGLSSPIREYQNTDIWIESQNAIIVIENKIDSGINSKKKAKDGSVTTQLDVYESLLEKEKKEQEKQYSFCFIIKPNYNQLVITNKYPNWKVIEYNSVYNFFSKVSKDNLFKNLPYIQEFVKALDPLTQQRKTDYKDIIENGLMKRIAELKAEKR